MSVQRVEFPGRLNEAEREPWCAWLRDLGISPNDVLVAPGWIERDEDARQVRYLGLDRSRGAVARTVQLEAAPAPFPAA